jgi:hypothetical protein
VTTHHEPAVDGQCPRSRNEGTLKVALIVASAVVLGAAAAIAIAIVVRHQRPSGAGPANANGPTRTLPSSSPDTAAALNGWEQFGGIDAHPGSGGNTVVLDTHNTTETWTTKWSGLIAPGESACTLHFSARVRDISHTSGVPGGYGIGLATTQNDPSGQVMLNGNRRLRRVSSELAGTHVNAWLPEQLAGRQLLAGSRREIRRRGSLRPDWPVRAGLTWGVAVGRLIRRAGSRRNETYTNDETSRLRHGFSPF